MASASSSRCLRCLQTADQDYIDRDPHRAPLMSPRERVTLNPCEKFRRHGLWPWRLTVHVCLALLTTAMVCIWTENDCLHARHALRHFYTGFIGVSGNPGERERYASSPSELASICNNTLEHYWHIDRKSLSDFRHLSQPPVLHILWLNGDQQRMVLDDAWEEDPAYGHFINSVDRLKRIRDMHFVIHILDPFPGSWWWQCLSWNIRVHFDYGGSGQIKSRLSFDLTECSDGELRALFLEDPHLAEERYTHPALYLLPFFCLPLTLLSAALTIRSHALRRGGGSLRSTGDSNDILLRELAVGWLDPWLIFVLLANAVQTLAALQCIQKADKTADVYWRLSLLGVGAGMAWLTLLRYLKFFPTYYVLIRTLARAFPRLLRFLSGLVPLLLAYALCGTCVFWPSSNFASLSDALMGMFSLLNGDIIHDMFMDMTSISWFWGQVYCYTFLCLFIYVVLNIFLAIVDEAFCTAKRFEELHLRPSESSSTAGSSTSIRNVDDTGGIKCSWRTLLRE
ncbi:mucolipin, putative [Perkinsus marinus ATCC 50983]|uniref:Mucolipin, putative n=1 Tax=Perkinsus marinus (strain ATCC 50983 / TXsc) TaxID=423536 RepID=C5KUA8_PERM5|nr:mucolipin, putative [Perkinsus marinus ATCC 50983]EER12150.1 mucolipin, putative [Perkinsus marinus ATCC 50983]|eukprot:XP_002780355.1 mucolipin, putative [Perkinsus marinus ATCC 50983]